MAKIIKNGIEYNHSTTNFEIGETPPLDPSVELWFDTSEEMPMADYIVERGTTNGWEWEKWASGKAVATGRFQKLGALGSTTGITDVHVRHADFYFPTGLFVSAPFCFCDHAVWSYAEWCTCTSGRTDYTQVRRYSNYNGKDLQIDVVIKAEGTWK